jgi:predicted nucleotidyltransferase
MAAIEYPRQRSQGSADVIRSGGSPFSDRPDYKPGSDVGVLVEFQPGKRVGFFELYDLEEELSRAFGGRKVDLNAPKPQPILPSARGG